ncbi:hypothetical protein ES288_A09G130500v1 [Gossypium darwinii]|uniref:Secreted protein n=1 Tax=Gossypium darwinii TaxID=34276 RepID=A0A5D2FAK7_GOSDA|nr:hypothetical protein ES288_A09G130500v1 [Gossypium darwinii]
MAFVYCLLLFRFASAALLSFCFCFAGLGGQRGRSLPFWCKRCQGSRPSSGAPAEGAHGGCTAQG